MSQFQSFFVVFDLLSTSRYRYEDHNFERAAVPLVCPRGGSLSSLSFVRFLGDELQNHSYVDFNLVGASGSASVQCYTDLDTCCREMNGPDRGDWYFPNGEILLDSDGNFDVYESERTSNVQLCRRNNATTAGIYRCEIYRDKCCQW